jgi:hypothetical protein
MQFFTSIVLAALASLASANVVEFINQDNTVRHVVFTSQVGQANIDTLTIGGMETSSVTLPSGWIGNWYSYNDGSPNVPGILGEVSLNSWDNINFFDVSAIVNPNDNEGVKMIFPKDSSTPVSGCQSFPCSNAYNQPNDIATMSTTDDTFVCLLGTLTSTRRRSVNRMPSEFIEA